MAPSSSPTVKRRRLAAELRRLREAAKLTIDQVAERLEWSAGKISKIENARVSVMPRDARYLLDVYGVADPERELLVTLARESRQRGWWQQYGAIPEWFGTYVGLESEAVSVSSYQGEYVPGLLQTHDYAMAVHRAFTMTQTDEEIEQHVALRMARQERLDAPATPVQCGDQLAAAHLSAVHGGRNRDAMGPAQGLEPHAPGVVEVAG